MGKFGPKIASVIFDEFVDGITAFVTPENIGRRLADVVAIGLIAMFAPAVITIHFRQAIADMFEILGRLIIEGATELPGLLKGFGTKVGQSIVDVLMTEIEFPLIGGVKVWELIAGTLLPAPAAVYEFFKQGLADILVRFLADLPGIAIEGLQKTGEGIGFFFTDILPALLTGEYLPAVLDALVTFFGTTLPDAITIEAPKIPGAVLDALFDLPDLALGELERVTEVFSKWISGLGSFVTDSFIPWDWIKAAANAFVDEIVKWLGIIWGSGIISDWVSGLSTWLTDNFKPWDWIKAAFETLGTEIAGALAGLVTVFTRAGSDMLGGLKSGAESKFVDLRVFFFGLPGQVIGWLGNLGSKLYDYAYDAVGEMAKGVTNAIKKVTDAFGKLASALNPFDSPPGFHALPQQYLDYGQKIMDGLRGGLFSGWGEVLTMLGTFPPEIQKWLFPVIEAAQTAGGEAGHAFGRAMLDAIAAIPATTPSLDFPVGDTPRGHRMPGGGTAISPEATPGIDWMMGVGGKWQAQYEAIDELVKRFNALPDDVRKSLGETTGIMDQFADANVTVFEDFSARTQEVQDALDHVAAGSATMHDALLLANVGFTELANGIVQVNLGLMTTEELAAMLTAGITGSGDAAGYTLAQYDLLASSLEKAKANQLGMHDATILANAGFTDLADAIMQVNLGLMSTDDLALLVQAKFTEVATSATVLGAQWTTAFADAMGREDLLSAVGSAGVRILDTLNTVLTVGGQQNVESAGRSSRIDADGT